MKTRIKIKTRKDGAVIYYAQYKFIFWFNCQDIEDLCFFDVCSSDLDTIKKYIDKKLSYQAKKKQKKKQKLDRISKTEYLKYP